MNSTIIDATPTQEDDRQSKLLHLLNFEESMRQCSDIKQLGFHLVNELRTLLTYRQAFLLRSVGGKNDCKLMSASSLSSFDPNAQFVRWIEKAIKFFGTNTVWTAEAVRLGIDDCPEDMKDGWLEYSMPYVAWCPMLSAKGEFLGGLWLSRERPWTDSEMILLNRVAKTAAYSYSAMKKPRRWRLPSVSGYWKLTAVAVLLGIMVIPIRMSVLAPFEVVADTPVIISSPVDAVIDTVSAQPNTDVQAGELLFSLDDTELRNAVEIARKQLQVRQAQFLTANQGAFSSNDSKAQLSLLKEEIDLARVELEYHLERMSKVEVRAPENGLLIYGDPDDWEGKPVNVGERIMEIADPERVKLRIDVPVTDAIILLQGAEVDVFLNSDPLNPFDAVVEKASYHAREIPGGILAYKVSANVTGEPDAQLRIGFRGTAKVYGETVPLFFYLFRRPIATLRQYIGF